MLKYTQKGAFDDDEQNYNNFVEELELTNIITHEQSWEYFDNLGDNNIISYDFWRGIMHIETNQNTYNYLFKLVVSLKEEKITLDKRIDDILTFNPYSLSKEIEETQNNIQKIHKEIQKNSLLKGLEEPLNHITKYFTSVSTISSNYDNIYKNIVKPIQDEGKEGVKATVKWAIFSIIISTLISLLINNWNNIYTIFTNI